MSGLEAIGAVISAISIVTKVVKHFGTQRNAPRQVERLARMLAELRDERLLQASMSAEQTHIHEMVNRCTDILDREATTTGQKGRAWKFFWSADAEARLKDHNDELERELDRLQRRVHMFGTMQVLLPHVLMFANAGQFPVSFEDEDLDDLSVAFLDAHDITVQNAEGYKVYRAYSIYEFGTVAHREEFLVHVRERQLLGRYFAEKIWEKGDLIAQQKVVRLWRKTTSRESQTTTLAFIGRDERPYERPLVDFRRSPMVRGNHVDLVDVVGGFKTTLECRPPPKLPKAKGKRFGIFGKGGSKGGSISSTSEGAAEDSDATRFKAAFEANHPATSTFSPLTLSPTGLGPDFHDLTAPPLPSLTPSTSRAPTLSTLSIPSASFSFLMDDSPISPRSSVLKKDELSFPR
ncbi:hypothetical protein C8A00DRAFT_18552 [Chaetomidium leptoderma]|uniref:Uncharacterized protein n=1 Tax=Chaetomidium leptoderma TaxID=669021 RepID=A0AAN6ZTS6_9PEZI|nr:hypothetical protein C8A00DRAFT_18552 [Chaetomidium leptoderma]